MYLHHSPYPTICTVCLGYTHLHTRSLYAHSFAYNLLGYVAPGPVLFHGLTRERRRGIYGTNYYNQPNPPEDRKMDMEEDICLEQFDKCRTELDLLAKIVFKDCKDSYELILSHVITKSFLHMKQSVMHKQLAVRFWSHVRKNNKFLCHQHFKP